MKHSAYLDEVYQFHANLAVAVGLNEAIVLRKLHGWIELNTKNNNNRRQDANRIWRVWCYQTLKQWQAQFPFWSEVTVRRIFKNLKDKGVVIASDAFNDSAADRKLWYTIDYDIYQRLMDRHTFESYEENGAIKLIAGTDQIDRPSEREGADQIDRSEADQNDRLSVNIEINTNCLSDTNPKIKKTPLSPSETSPPVAAKYAKHYEFYLVYRQELHNDQNYYVTMWDGYKTNFGRLVADGYTPAQYRTAIRQALKEWDKKFINPGSMVKHIAKLLADAGQSKQGSAASPRVRQYYDEVERRKNGGQFTDGAIISDDYPPVKTLRNAGPPPLE